jgi:type IV pilus biogenesis protein CpaD/CtpE
MRTLALAVLVSLSGCAALDWAAGVDPKTGEKTETPSPAERAAPIADVILPGAGGLLAAAAGLWAAIRGRQWKQAAISTFETIEHGAKVGQAVGDLKKDLARVHEKVGVYELVNKVVRKFDKEGPPRA